MKLAGSPDGRRALLATVGILLLAAALRGSFPAADPPWRSTVGIVWHDEGAWVHNARNKALFGVWRTDDWNPMFVAPVFTALEYVSFEALGVGVRQARLVSMLMGLASVLWLGAGVARLAGRRAGLMAAALLATNYVYVMWNRAALMEATMTSLIVAGWYCIVRAERAPAWGAAAALAAWLAYFTKAAAAFFVGAIGLVAVMTIVQAWWAAHRAGSALDWRAPAVRAGLWMLGGLVGGAALAAALFVAPFWNEYAFYNWQMSVLRKPEYSMRAFVDRVSWFPIIHDFFTRMWFITTVGSIVLIGWIGRIGRTGLAERLVIGWLGLGILELFTHDVGNERRFLFLAPALITLTAVALGGHGRLWPADAVQWPRRRLLLMLPVVALAAYTVAGGLLRLIAIYQVRPGVWSAAVPALGLTVLLMTFWPRVSRALSATLVPPRAAWLLVACVMAGDLAQYAQWASGRTYENYDASRQLASRLPAGTLVHGKLANGLALENRIRPIFIGQDFGNYADRLTRDDIRYVLTYVRPRVGYEGRVILDVLRAYPQRRELWRFDVAETTVGHDRAALIEKGR